MLSREWSLRLDNRYGGGLSRFTWAQSGKGQPLRLLSGTPKVMT